MSHHDKPKAKDSRLRTPWGHASDSRSMPPCRPAGCSALLAAALTGLGMPLPLPVVLTIPVLPAGLALLATRPAHAQITVSVRVVPPPLPFYVQPALVGEGYLWLPGYWAWSPEGFDYFWVPGTWALAPRAGLLWTPGWWGFENNAYRWHAGYWAERVGYYGGIDYGHGYSGYGYQGGRWEGGQFHYNTSVNNVSGSAARYTYRSTSFSNHNAHRASFNGGIGGVNARPTPVQIQQQAGRQAGPTATQLQHEDQALRTPTQRQAHNRGAPPVAATPRANEFDSPGAVKARATPSQRPERQVPVQQQQRRQHPESAPPQERQPPRQQERAPARHQRQPGTRPGQPDDEPQRLNRGQGEEQR